MKRCPECRRDYYDDSLIYCLDDGNALLEGPASGQSVPPAVAGGLPPSSDFENEPKTAILSGPSAGGSELQTAILQPPATAGGSDSAAKSQGSVGGWQRQLAVVGIAAIVLVGGSFEEPRFKAMLKRMNLPE